MSPYLVWCCIWIFGVRAKIVNFCERGTLAGVKDILRSEITNETIYDGTCGEVGGNIVERQGRARKMGFNTRRGFRSGTAILSTVVVHVGLITSTGTITTNVVPFRVRKEASILHFEAVVDVSARQECTE